MWTTIFFVSLVALALGINWIWTALRARKEADALTTLNDIAALGEVVPDTLHPKVDPIRCIGSGACVNACPEKEVLAIVHGQAKLINPLACVGHAACMEACPVNAITVVFGTAKRGVDLPKVDAHFQTTRPGLYVIGELSGMGLIRNAVRQGNQAADHAASSGRRGTGGALDALVVGAGPSGIAATLRLMQAGMNVKLVEREVYGGTIRHYPRAKVVMTGTLEMPMFGKIRRRKMGKEDLLQLWDDIREKTNMPVETGVLVESLEEESLSTWKVHASTGTYRAANIFLALGRRGAPRKLDVPGEDLPKVAYRLLEPTQFRDQHVLVVGGGNSAVENALSLADAGVCKSVTISYRRGTFARCRAENRARIDEALRTGRVTGLMPSEVVAIRPNDVLLRMDGAQRQLPNDAIIIQIGGTTPSELLARFGVQVVTKYGQA